MLGCIYLSRLGAGWIRLLWNLALCSLLPAAGLAAQDLAGMRGSLRSTALQSRVATAVSRVLARPWSPALSADQLAVTAVDLEHPDALEYGCHRGAEAIYPASVVKLFFLAAVHHDLEAGRIHDSPEVRRAMRDMIVESYNEPAHFLVDLISGTTSGPELSTQELRAWWVKRNCVNDWFGSLGYPRSLNLSKKPWCEGPYGREKQATDAFEPRRNWLTTDATARLLSEIALRRMVSPVRCDQMLALLSRDFLAKPIDPEDQAHGYTGIGLKPGMKLWSKCGLTSETRHDAALVELPDGHRWVVVTFTVGHATERNLIPALASEILGLR